MQKAEKAAGTPLQDGPTMPAENARQQESRMAERKEKRAPGHWFAAPEQSYE